MIYKNRNKGNCMKIGITLTTFFILLGSYLIFGESDGKIKWFKFDDGVTASKKSSKKMVVDVYTDWCGWCKKMDSGTYGEKKVSEYINKEYVAVKLNAESRNKVSFMGEALSEQELSMGFGITGYPATIFLDENQKPITVLPGYVDAQEFLHILKYINEDIYKSKKYEEYRKDIKQ